MSTVDNYHEETVNPYYELTVTLSEYPGNHERELTYWLFGLEDEYMPGGWKKIERAHAERLAWINDGHMEPALEMYVHEEYGMIWQSIEGSDLNTVSWKLTEPPTDEQWQSLLDVLALGYQPQKMSYEKAKPALITLTNPTLTKVETIREVVRS